MKGKLLVGILIGIMFTALFVSAGVKVYNDGRIAAEGSIDSWQEGDSSFIWNPRNSSLAIGYDVKAGVAGIALGAGATASEILSTAIGGSTTASAYCSIAMGDSTTASGQASTAMGSSTLASGQYSIATGRSTNATGDFSTTMGEYTRASGRYSIAMGQSTLASALLSTALGSMTTANGTFSTAMGSATLASGSVSTAMGAGTVASGLSSTAMGMSTTAQAYDSVVIGRYNLVSGSPGWWISTDPLFVIGNGASASSRSNAMTVLKDGRVGIGTATPQTILHVNAVMKLEPTNSPGTCTSTLEGSVYYDASMKKPCYCDGTSWKLFDGVTVCT